LAAAGFSGSQQFICRMTDGSNGTQILYIKNKFTQIINKSFCGFALLTGGQYAANALLLSSPAIWQTGLRKNE